MLGVLRTYDDYLGVGVFGCFLELRRGQPVTFFVSCSFPSCIDSR